MWPFTKKKKPIPSLYDVKYKPLLEDDPLDENIIQRVQKKHPDWNRGKVMELIREYKTFLYFCAKDDEENVPSAEVDEIWHEHILFTKDYENWCNFLGKKIHHNPEKIGETKSFDAGFQKTKNKIKETTKKRVSSKNSNFSNSKNYTPTPESDNFATNMLLFNTMNDSGCSHSHSHESDSSSSSCSSSSCSSSSCSSSSCGGGGD